MPYQKPPSQGQPDGQCTVCGSPANILRAEFRIGTVVDCSRCGDFEVEHGVVRDFPLPYTDDKCKALASYLIRKLQRQGRVLLTRTFFGSLRQHLLPAPAELCDNLLLWFFEQADGRVGKIIGADKSLSDPDLLGGIGAIDTGDAQWAADALTKNGLITFQVMPPGYSFRGQITSSGWNRIEELQRAHVSSRYAFFARKFANSDLDALYKNCLRQAVADTGFELRTVTQKAGHIDALIEDEIRRCRFLLADLSDGNAGAYWEAGLAEGLGKPVIYICRDNIETHFDTDHRQTVRWDLNKPDETAKWLKAVIRNTLLGDAKQDD